jgi:hypothetical protein
MDDGSGGVLTLTQQDLLEDDGSGADLLLIDPEYVNHRVAERKVERLLRNKDTSLFNKQVLQAEDDFVYHGGMSVPPEVLEKIRRQQTQKREMEILKWNQKNGLMGRHHTTFIGGAGRRRDLHNKDSPQREFLTMEEKTAGIERGAVLREMLRHTSSMNDPEEKQAQIELRKAQDEMQWKQSYLKGLAIANQSHFVAKATAMTLGLTSIGIPAAVADAVKQQKSSPTSPTNNNNKQITSSSSFSSSLTTTTPTIKIPRDVEEEAVITQRMHQQWDVLLRDKLFHRGGGTV